MTKMYIAASNKDCTIPKQIIFGSEMTMRSVSWMEVLLGVLDPSGDARLVGLSDQDNKTPIDPKSKNQGE